MKLSYWCYIDLHRFNLHQMSFIVAHFTDTSTEIMTGAESREWVHHNYPRGGFSPECIMKAKIARYQM